MTTVDAGSALLHTHTYFCVESELLLSKSEQMAAKIPDKIICVLTTA